MNKIQEIWHQEPAVVIGFLLSVALVVGQQALDSGIVSSEGSVNLVRLVLSLIPVIQGYLTRTQVSPAS